MDNHTRSGKCKKYSPYIKFSPIMFHCNLCLNSKSTKRNVHNLYKHLEKDHKAEMSSRKTLKLHQNNSIEKSAIQKSEQQFSKNTKDPGNNDKVKKRV